MRLIKNRLIRANKIAASFFSQQLDEHPSENDYVYGRIGEETAKRFHVGYCPRSGLIEWLNDHGVSAEEASAVGLIWLNEDNLAVEVFRHRIMFPIVHAGIIVGFGGRALDNDAKSKYINSKTSPLYNKGEVLYGLWYSRKFIHEIGFALVIEGYFDFLKLYSEGICNCAACCGTAFMVGHALTLKRWTRHVCCLFDGDEAGRKMSGRVRKISFDNDLHAVNINLPDGLDPEDYINERGGKKLRSLIGSKGFDLSD